MKKLLGISILCALLILSGCTGAAEKVYPNCYVYRIDGACAYYDSLVCSNGSDTYYYDNNAVYAYKDGKAHLLFEVDDGFYSIACTSEDVYYATQTTLYRYNIESKEVECIHDVIHITDLRANGENVFVCENRDEGWGMYYLFYEGEEICINELLGDSADNRIEFNEYVMEEIDGEICVYEENQWYDYYDEVIMVNANGDKIIIDNFKFTFGNETVDYTDVIEQKDKGAATTRSHYSVYEDKLYILYQYGEGLQYGGYNSDSYCRVKDAIYVVDFNTKEITLVYETEDNSEQIGGFSVERNELYLAKQDGVYRCDMQGNNEVKIVDGYYETLVFEDCNDYFFIYDGSDLWEAKLLLID